MKKYQKGSAKLFIPVLVFVLVAGALYYFFRTSETTNNSTENLPSGSLSSPTPTTNNARGTEPPIPDNSELTPSPSGEAKDGCVISGCSNEICSEEEMVSTCIFRPENACYVGATCEKQNNGKCGWTETSELTSCLNQN